MESKNIQLERTVFFSDAVVAIAITLLALELKVETANHQELQFSDIMGQWKSFVAFFLSFINIATFWKIHYTFFSHIKKMDDRLLFYNILWLLFIVLVPFSTSLFGHHFFSKAAIFTYSINILFVTIFQNFIWDYAAKKTDFAKSDATDDAKFSELRIFCNLDIVNSLLAVALSFVNPILAFVLLFTKLPIILAVIFFYRKNRRKNRRKKNIDNRIVK